MLFGRQLLDSSNTTSNVVRNLTVLSSTTDRTNRVCVVKLRVTQRTSKLNINSSKINVNDIVLVNDEKAPKRFWRIAIVTGVLPSRDSEIRETIVRIAKSNAILKRPLNKLFTVENTYHDTDQTNKEREQKLRREAAVIGELKRKYEC